MTTKNNTLILIIVFILTCTLGSGWWVSQTNLINLLTQQQLLTASAYCERIIDKLILSDPVDPGFQSDYVESIRELQRQLSTIKLMDKHSFNPSTNTSQQKFKRLITTWQSELLPNINLLLNNNTKLLDNSQRETLVKHLKYLGSGLEDVAEQININTSSRLVTNNVLFIIAIILLLLLCYVLYKLYFGKIFTNDGSKDTKHGLNNTKPDRSGIYWKNIFNANKTYSNTQQHITSLNIANQALTQLIEEPESIEPFFMLMNDIEKLTNATSSAIFITPNPSSQLVLLACTDPNDAIWSNAVPHKILPRMTIDDDDNSQILEFYDDAQSPEFKYVCIFLNRTVHCFSFLVLKIPTKFIMSDAVTLNLKEYSERLSSIVSSVQSARLKLRNAQFEERATIARELHDSLAQSLSYLKIQTSRLQSILTGSDIQAYSKSMEIDAMMQDLRSNLNIAYRHLRELISTFRLTIGGKNFSQALTDSVEEFAKRSGIAFDIDNRLPADILTVTEETQLLHIIRESLSNVVRHSQANFALLSIHYNKSGQITSVIEDDGIGLPDVSNSERHFGIIIMQERAHSIGGNISLTERVDGGACLKIVFQASKHIDAISNIN